MKKITALVLTIIMLFTLTACNDSAEETTTTEETSTTAVSATAKQSTKTEDGFISEEAKELYEALTSNTKEAYDMALQYIQKTEPSTTYDAGYTAVLWNLSKETDLMLVQQSRELYLRQYDEQRIVKDDIELYNNIDYSLAESSVNSFDEGERMKEGVIGELYYTYGDFYHLGKLVYEIPFDSEICGYCEGPDYNYIVYVNGEEIVLLTTEDNNIFTEMLLSNDLAYIWQIAVHERTIIFIDDFDRVNQIDVMNEEKKSSVICEKARDLNNYGEYETYDGEVCSPEYYITAEGEKVPWEWNLA